MFLQSVLDAGFKKYGRVIADIDTSEIVKLMDSHDMPEDVVYVAGDEKLENGREYIWWMSCTDRVL